jgi:hypothetical protein
MVTFNCDVDVIVKAKQRLENDQELDPTEFLSRIVLFCQVKPEHDVASVASKVKVHMNTIGACTGLVVQYEHSLVIIVETTAVDVRSILMTGIDKLAQCFENGFICSSEEGVKRTFSDFNILCNAGIETTVSLKDLSEGDEDTVVDALAGIVHGMLIEEPQTLGADKLLSQIAQSGHLFTREEFLKTFDVQMHICAVFETETPQIEEIVIENDVHASLCASHVQKL